MKRLLALCALALIALAGCGDQKSIALMGQWPGEFVNDSPKVDVDQKFRGFLQLYAADRYKIRMESANQSFEIEGKWKREEKALTLSVGEVRLNNPSELNQEIYKLQIVSPDAIRTAFGKEFALRLSPDGKELRGLTVKLGSESGAFAFFKRAQRQLSEQVVPTPGGR